MTPLKRVIYVVGGIFWFLFSVGFGFFLVDYIAGGAGLQLLGGPVFLGGPVSSGSVLLGLVHVIGFVTAIVICFAIGASMCARALVSDREHEQVKHRAQVKS